MRCSKRRRAIGTAAVAVVLAACATRVEPMPAGPPPTDPGVAGALVIEQFLRAANASDIDSMARLFGTREGPVQQLWDRNQLEERMFILARILRHDDYSIEGTQIVPGRREEASQVMVNMRIGERSVVVPYTLVWSRYGTWLIEQIAIERITSGA